MRESSALNGYLSRTDADAAIARIDHSKLSRGDALDGVVTIDVEASFFSTCQDTCAPAIGVAHFESHVYAA